MATFGTLFGTPFGNDSNPTIPTIKVHGNAEISVSPDRAVLSFSIESREAKLDAAVADNDAKIQSVIGFLQSANVEARLIQTDLMHTRPIYHQNRAGKTEAKVVSPVGYTVKLCSVSKRQT